MKKIIIIIATCIIFFLGFYSNGIYNEISYSYERNLNGLYMSNGDNISSVMEYAHERETDGDWICINVAYDMKPELAYKTCVHECSHKAFTEIYAEKCEDNPSKCLEVLDE